MIAALSAIGACHKRSQGPRGGTGTSDAAWTNYRPTDSAQAFVALVRQLTFPQVSNSPYIDSNGNTVQSAIYPEQATYLLDPTHVKGLRPSNAIGRVIATITYSDQKYDLSYFGFHHGDPHKVVYWWLYMPTDDATSWIDYFVSVDDSGNVAPVVQRGFQWLDDSVPYSSAVAAADWFDHHHLRPDSMKKVQDGHGWTSCGSGCCN